jgi:hypothetical protein
MKRKLGGFDEPESMSGSNATEVGAAPLSDGGAGAPAASGAVLLTCACADQRLRVESGPRVL